nr:hypothetical protein [Microbacterium hydrocarbonoxydans]
MRTTDAVPREAFERARLLPGLSAEYLSAVRDRLHDRSRADAEQQLLETLKLLVLTDLCGLSVDTSGELASVRSALADSPQAYAELRKAMCQGRRPGDRGVQSSTRDAPADPIRCVSAYVCTFGPFTPRTARLWPDAQAVMAELRVGVSGLNDLSASWRESWREPSGETASPWRALGAVSHVSELVDVGVGDP